MVAKTRQPRKPNPPAFPDTFLFQLNRTGAIQAQLDALIAKTRR